MMNAKVKQALEKCPVEEFRKEELRKGVNDNTTSLQIFPLRQIAD